MYLVRTRCGCGRRRTGPLITTGLEPGDHRSKTLRNVDGDPLGVVLDQRKIQARRREEILAGPQLLLDLVGHSSECRAREPCSAAGVRGSRVRTHTITSARGFRPRTPAPPGHQLFGRAGELLTLMSGRRHKGLDNGPEEVAGRSIEISASRRGDGRQPKHQTETERQTRIEGAVSWLPPPPRPWRRRPEASRTRDRSLGLSFRSSIERRDALGQSTSNVSTETP